MLALAAIHNWGQQQLRGFVAAGSPPHPHQTRRRATAPRRKLPLLGVFVVPVPPPLNVEERRPRTPPEQDFHTGTVSGAKSTASTPNFRRYLV